MFSARDLLLPNRLQRCYSIDDLRRLTRRRLPRAVFGYLEGAAEDEVTLRRNVSGFDQYELLPRFLVDVADIDLSTSIMGTRIQVPYVLAPTGMSRLFHHLGEAAVARAAATAGTVYSLSSAATMSIEEVAEAATGPKWFQIYVWRDRGLLREFIQRCKASNYTALCLTVDLPIAGKRERDLRNGFTVPPRITARTVFDTLLRPDWLWHYLTTPVMQLANVRGHSVADADLFSVIEYTTSQFDPSVTWEDARWMIEEWGGPFAIKGLLTPEDAVRAVEIGATAVVVSNHGGRQLDHSPAAVDALPGIVEAVAGGAEVILDGGIRRGTDIAKALALGADACMIGRAYLYGLGAGGEAGVSRALEILREEFARTLKLLGCTRVTDVDGTRIRRRAPGLD